MSKGKQRPPQYNRPSKGYQQNLYKQQLKEQDVKLPKQIDVEKISKINRILGIVLIVATILLWIFVNWKVGVACLVITAAYFGGFVLYMNNYTKKFITAYKQMGIPKDMYIKQLRKSGTDVKTIERMSKTWDRVKAESVIETTGKKK